MDAKRYFALRLQTASENASIIANDLKRGASTQGRDDRLRLGRIETISYTTAHGFSLEGKLLYPAGYVEGKRYPLIVDAYPMNSGKSWMHPMGGNQAWATAGYMVFKPHQARAPHDPELCGRQGLLRSRQGPGRLGRHGR